MLVAGAAQSELTCRSGETAGKPIGFGRAGRFGRFLDLGRGAIDCARGRPFAHAAAYLLISAMQKAVCRGGIQVAGRTDEWRMNGVLKSGDR